MNQAVLAALLGTIELVARVPELQDATAQFLASAVSATPFDATDDEVGTILIKAGTLLGGTA